MNYSVLIIPSAEKDLNKLSPQYYTRCRQAILSLEKEPRPHGCQKLAGEEGYRIRVGDYRILYRIDDNGKGVYIYRVKHRRDVYR